LNRNDETTQQLAEALVRGTASLPENLSSEDRLVLAWALKDFATRAWASNPPDVVTTADTLDSLVDVGIPEPSNSQGETEAIAAWVRGLALLTKGEATLAIDSLDNAAAKFSSIEQTTNAAHTQSAKMMALSQIGKDDLAIETGLTAYETLSIAHEELAAAKISLNLGNLLWNRGAYADSLLRYERAQTAFRQLGHAPLEAAANLGRTNSLATLGRFDEALEQYASAKAVCEESSLLTLEAVVVEWRAHTQLARGRYSEALQGLEAARSRYESLELQQN
jgi:tetratricopeptide (TPR) repeat protein